MAKGYGQTTYGANGGGAVLSSNGAPEYATGGITIDWATVPAAAGPVTLIDGQIIPDGVKYIPFGTTLVQITASSKFGPHQAGATNDGRQTPVKGKAFCMNQTILETDAESEYGPGAIDGGTIFQSRLKKLNDAGTAYVPLVPDATFNLAFPRFRFAEH